MKRKLIRLLILSALCNSSLSYAEKADSSKPVAWEAAQAFLDETKQVRTLTGNVIISRGTMVLKADKVILSEDPAGYSFATLFAAPGSVASFRQKRDGGADLWMDGQAERIEYDGRTELVKLVTRARMRRMDGNKPSDEVEGEFISYDSRAEFFSVANTASGESKAGAGRVKGVIQPHPENKVK